MKGARMAYDWRTIQLFLGDDGVSEVSADHNDPYAIMCTCKIFRKVSKCAHTKFVRQTMQSNDGHYTVHIHAEIDPMEASIAMEDSAAFRDFVIKYGKVEIL